MISEKFHSIGREKTGKRRRKENAKETIKKEGKGRERRIQMENGRRK
jgi:hypothetical protein